MNTFEATEVEKTEAPSSLSMKLNVISGERFGMVPQGSKIQSIISVAGHQVIRNLSEPSEFTLMHLDTYADYLRQAVTIKDAYPIPRTDDSLSKLGNAKFFTTLDLDSAFWQVPLRKKDRGKTGFACELGSYQWKRMPFGLCNATATFQRLMAQALTRVTKKYGNLVMCYVDDVVIATPTLEDHIDRLDEVFGCMKRAGSKCKPSKCEILRDPIKYLGRMVDRHGVRPDPEAVEQC